MVLLPAIARDSVVVIMRTLVDSGLDATRLLLLVSIVAVLSLPFMSLWFLLRDLTRFYFHAQHLRHEGHDVFTPRFTLTGLRLPLGELDGGMRLLDAARLDPATVELLIPARERTRALIDKQLDAYGGLGRIDAAGDVGRAAGLFELVASRARSLPEEVAKVEHGMVRHMLRIQVIVLRYVKALRAFLTTALAVFAADAVVESGRRIEPNVQLALSCVVLVWAPCVVLAVGAPVRWLEQLLRSEGAAGNAIRTDDEFTRVEHVASAIAGTGWLLSAGSLVVTLIRASDAGRVTVSTSLTVLIVTGAGMAFLLARWRRRSLMTSDA